jgi:hypothetical protein
MGFVAKWDGDRCPVCKERIMTGDEVQNSGDIIKHVDCSAAQEGPPEFVRWDVSAETIDRNNLEDMEMRRIAPLAKQGACPSCFLELPATGLCDEHGRVSA